MGTYERTDPCVFCKKTDCDSTGIVVTDDAGTPLIPCTLVHMHLPCFTEASHDGYTATTQ